MTDPFALTVRIPDTVESIIIGAHTNKKDMRKDTYHVIIDGVVLCSGEKEPRPSTYLRLTGELMTAERLPGRCMVCRDAAAAWAGHPEWVEGEVL